MTNDQSFAHPFSRAYWKAAADELKNTRMLIFAALIVALRVALKSLSIPIAADLYINIGFFANAFGSMVYGPVVALLGAAVSDTLGAILFPKGAYFFPFIFIEMAGSLVFALYLYRVRGTVRRVILSRFTIDLGVNVILNTPVMWLYYSMVMGRSYALFDLMRILKNLAMFPIESVLLTLFLKMMIPAARRLGLVKWGSDALQFDRKSILTLIVTFLIGCGCAAGYYVYHYNNTSLSASYTAAQRQAVNRAVTMKAVPEDEAYAAVIDSAFSRIGLGEITNAFTLYRMDEALMAEAGVSRDDVFALSKSPAAKAAYLTRVGHGTAVTDKGTGEVLKAEVIWEEAKGDEP